MQWSDKNCNNNVNFLLRYAFDLSLNQGLSLPYIPYMDIGTKIITWRLLESHLLAIIVDVLGFGPPPSTILQSELVLTLGQICVMKIPYKHGLLTCMQSHNQGDTHERESYNSQQLYTCKGSYDLKESYNSEEERPNMWLLVAFATVAGAERLNHLFLCQLSVSTLSSHARCLCQKKGIMVLAIADYERLRNNNIDENTRKLPELGFPALT